MGIDISNSNKKLVMWYKMKELCAKGFNKTQIAHLLEMDRGTVRRYLKMSEAEFLGSQAYKRVYPLKLEEYEGYVQGILEKYPFLSCAQVHDWLREQYPDFPEVCEKTVFNFVAAVRRKYDICKSEEKHPRSFEKLPDTPYGKYAQMDFGESWMQTDKGKSVKVYFFAIVLTRSRYKFVYFSCTPFNTELAVYAHELAFSFFGGKPEKIIYDQDKVLLSRENLGDLIYTKGFRAFVEEQHFTPVFCRKADPQSKGKIENVVKYVKRNFVSGRTFHTPDELNREVLLWLGRTGNGKVHAATGLVPGEEFRTEQAALMPYYGTPEMPQKKMREYHVRKDNTIHYRGNYYSVPYGTYKNGDSVVWLQESDGQVELFDKETGKTICRHESCPLRGKIIRDKRHGRPESASLEEKRERILKYVSGSREVALWMENLQRDKPRYYRDNLDMLVRMIPAYDKEVIIEAVRICLDKDIYNGMSVREISCSIQRKRYDRDRDAPCGPGIYPDAADIRPEQTNINQYNKFFEK